MDVCNLEDFNCFFQNVILSRPCYILCIISETVQNQRLFGQANAGSAEPEGGRKRDSDGIVIPRVVADPGYPP